MRRVISNCFIVLLALSVLLPVKRIPGQTQSEEAGYYVCLFAYQGVPRLPRNSHTFAAFLKVQGDQAEVHTISWMPKSLDVVAFRKVPEQGVNLDLAQTLGLAESLNARVRHWGPYKIRKKLFDEARERIEQLNEGRFLYKARHGDARDRSLNCIHAVADLQKNPALDTGLSYGVPATLLVVNHFRPLLLEGGKTFPELARHLGLEGFGETQFKPTDEAGSPSRESLEP